MTRATHPALAGGPLGFAHRGFTPPGLVGDSPSHAWENTLEAFRAARDLGLRHLETDVRATSDGVVVVMHDPDLVRTTGRDTPVGETSWAQLGRARVAGRHPVPRLEDVLAALPDAVLNVDVKDPRAVRPMAEVLTRTGTAERVVVAAFDGRRARAVQRLAPGVARSAGMAGSAGARLAAGLERVSVRLGRSLLARAADGADALQLPERYGRLTVVTPRLVELAHDVGVQVHVWTVDEPSDMDRLLDLGVDGLMSDRADLLAQVLTRRRQARP